MIETNIFKQSENMAGKFTVAEKLAIIDLAEKHSNIVAADEFYCDESTVRQIRKLKQQLMDGVTNARAQDAETNLRRRFAMRAHDSDEVQKVEKLIRANERKYMLKRFVNENNHGRHTDIRYLLLDEYFDAWLTHARDVQEVCVLPKMVLYAAYPSYFFRIVAPMCENSKKCL